MLYEYTMQIHSFNSVISDVIVQWFINIITLLFLGGSNSYHHKPLLHYSQNILKIVARGFEEPHLHKTS